MSFTCLVTYRTFVTSEQHNSKQMDSERCSLLTEFETFHEIIYGKPARCKRAPRFFFALMKLTLLSTAFCNRRWPNGFFRS
jgi:hypothetical protein